VKKNFGMMLLGVWLVLHGLESLISFSFHGLGTVMAILAVVAGVLIFIGK